MKPYQYNPGRLPDSHFEQGSLEHLEIGNEGRALDYRRTPFLVRELREGSGLAILEVLDFEDRGNTWEVPFEDIGSFQFALGSRRAHSAAVARHAAIGDRLNTRTAIPTDEGAQGATIEELAEVEREAAEWVRLRSTTLQTRVRPDFTRKEGHDHLYADLRAYMGVHGLADIEATFASHYVCKFRYSEFVKAHRIVIAEMGLVPYEGKAVREKAALEGQFDRAKRREHVIRRLGFVRAIYRSLGILSVLLYRGIHSRGAPDPPRNETFVSATTDLAIAEALACFREPSNANKDGYKVGVLTSQSIPIERVFMSYLETPQMNHPYRESEAVLLYDADEAF